MMGDREAGRPVGLLQALRALWREVDLYVVSPEDDDPGETLALDTYQRRLTRLGVQVTAIVMTSLTVLAWPTDFWIFPAGSDTLAAVLSWRLVLLAACTTGFLALAFHRALAERPTFVAVVAFSVSTAASGFLMGRVGGLDSPLFYGVYTTPLLTVLLVAPLRTRVAATAFVVVAYFAGYFAADPAHLHDAGIGTPVVWVAASCVTAVTVGHVMTCLLRSNFRQQRALQRLTSGLEQRVAAQTTELRSLATNLARVQEQERRHIAREIHDEMGQTLTGLRLELEHMQRTAAGTGAGEALDEGFRASAATLGSIHDAIDRVITALRPGVLDARGLVAALQAQASAVQRGHALECRVVVGIDEERLTPEQTIALYRIAQEALTNVARHARASRVDVSLQETPEGLRLAVADDGVGFDPALVDDEGCLGLRGIRERSRLLGGQCTVTSRAGRGTEIAVIFPCPAEGNAA